LSNFDKLLKLWQESQLFNLSFSKQDDESNQKHRDWQFILQEQDAIALLKHACDLFAYDLYQPIYQYQKVAEE